MVVVRNCDGEALKRAHDAMSPLKLLFEIKFKRRCTNKTDCECCGNRRPIKIIRRMSDGKKCVGAVTLFYCRYKIDKITAFTWWMNIEHWQFIVNNIFFYNILMFQSNNGFHPIDLINFPFGCPELAYN